jgi:hypothetical protein
MMINRVKNDGKRKIVPFQTTENFTEAKSDEQSSGSQNRHILTTYVLY